MLTVQNPNSIDWDNMPLAEMARGNALDTFYTLRCFHVLRDKLEDLRMVKTYESILEPATRLFIDIELEGLLVSIPKLKELDKILKDEILELEEELYEYPEVKGTDNLGSTLDLVRIFFSLERSPDKTWVQCSSTGFDLFPPIFTDKKQPSTSVEALEWLRDSIADEIERRKKHEKSNRRGTE